MAGPRGHFRPGRWVYVAGPRGTLSARPLGICGRASGGTFGPALGYMWPCLGGHFRPGRRVYFIVVVVIVVIVIIVVVVIVLIVVVVVCCCSYW